MLSVNYKDITPSEAVVLQKQLSEKVVLSPFRKKLRTIAGADISFNKFSSTVYAGIVVLSFPDLKIIHEETAIVAINFPYIPGLLAFREIPALATVWNRLAKKPDILVCDGHGIAHPRRMGIATHFGIVADTPTIGCGKTVLCGTYDPLKEEIFATSDLIHKNETVGVALRTKKKCNPVFVSPGYKITRAESVTIIKACTGTYRIPEPTRLAHLLVNRIRKADGEAENI